MFCGDYRAEGVAGGGSGEGVERERRARTLALLKLPWNEP